MKRWIHFTLFLFVMISVFPAQAAIFQVTTPAQFQTALTTARDNGESDTVRVAQGTYVGNFYYYPVAGENYGLTLEGGWSANFSTRTLDPENTILDGNRAGQVLSINKVTTSASGSVTVEGFTIRNGFSASDGAGVYVDSFPPGTVTIRSNIIEENESGGTGGGFWVSNDDTATKTGGPIHILDNIIRKNIGASGKDATSGGGRVYALDGFLFSNNLVYGNKVGGNPTFYGRGSGLYVSVIGGPVQIINNTVTGNTAYTDGGGIFVGRFGLSGFPAQEIQISNNIVRGNTATTGTGADLYVDIETAPGNTVAIAHNDFHDLFVPAGRVVPTGAGNIDLDPQFLNATDPDPANWDLHLQPDSLCVDTGNNGAPDLPATDLEGNPRVVDGDGDRTATVDMGAYESPVVAGPFDALIEELQARSEDLTGSTDKVEQKQKKAVGKALATCAVPSTSLATDVKNAGKAAKTLMKVFSGEFASHGDLFTLFQAIFDDFRSDIQALLDTAQTTLNGLPDGSSCKDKAQAVLTAAAAGFGSAAPDISIGDGNNGGWVLVPGTTSQEKAVIDFAVGTFKKIRQIVGPEDEMKPKARFVSNYIEVTSEKWDYVLDIAGQQIFRPKVMYPHLKSSFANDIGPGIEKWMAQPVPPGRVDEARRLASEAFGANYTDSLGINAVPVRELIASKASDSETLRYYEGRTMVNFRNMDPDTPLMKAYKTSISRDREGRPLTSVEPIDLPVKSYETSVTFTPGGNPIRVESSHLNPEAQRIVRLYREGLTNGFIHGMGYFNDDLQFGTFFAPGEWRFELSAYSWESVRFDYLDYPSLISFLECTDDCPLSMSKDQCHLLCNPYFQESYSYYPVCHDDTTTYVPYYIATPHYKQDFWHRWLTNGVRNGIRGNWLQENQTWEINDRLIRHTNLGIYDVECPSSMGQNACDQGNQPWLHCDGEQETYHGGGAYKLKGFREDLEKNHVAMIYAHGGSQVWNFDFYHFMKERDIWVTLHREGDEGLGKGNLRHLFLTTCSSMNWNHGPKHGQNMNLIADWMNGHIADGIRMICGTDGEYGGTHFDGLRFFKYYHLNDSITQSWFNMELENNLENVPVVVSYGSTEDEAAGNLFDGRFTKERGGKGWIIASELITEHLLTH